MRFELTRTLYALALLLALAGLVLRFAPAAVPQASAPELAINAMSEGPSEVPAAIEVDLFEPIVQSNAFDRARTAPRTRYVPPELAQQPVRTTAPVPRGPRLYGVAVGPTGSVALIDADPSIPGAEVYRLGDRVGDARLVSIGDTAVVLEGPAGRRVLTLPSSSRRSP